MMSTLVAIQPPERSAMRPRKLVWTVLGVLLTALFLFPFYMILNSSLMASCPCLSGCPLAPLPAPCPYGR